MLSAQSGRLGPVSQGTTPLAATAPTASTTEVSLPPTVATPLPALRSCLKGKTKAETQRPSTPPKQEPSLRAGGALRKAGEEGDGLPDDLSSHGSFSGTSFAADGRFSHRSSQSSFSADYEAYSEPDDEQPIENFDEKTPEPHPRFFVAKDYRCGCCRRYVPEHSVQSKA